MMRRIVEFATRELDMAQDQLLLLGNGSARKGWRCFWSAGATGWPACRYFRKPCRCQCGGRIFADFSRPEARDDQPHACQAGAEERPSRGSERRFPDRPGANAIGYRQKLPARHLTTRPTGIAPTRIRLICRTPRRQPDCRKGKKSCSVFLECPRWQDPHSVRI